MKHIKLFYKNDKVSIQQFILAFISERVYVPMI